MYFKVALLSLSLILCAAVNKLQAQYYFYGDGYYDSPLMFEIGGSFGGMNSLTDLGGKKGKGKKFIKDLNLKASHPATSIFIQATYNYMLGIRIEGTFGKVSGADSVLKKVKTSTDGRYERNLSFRSNISEIALIGEIHPLYIFRDYSGDKEPPRISPYILAGIGYYSFNPQALYKNRWVDLQPLHTGGQGFKELPDRQPYKLKQICFPVGFGAKYELSPILNVRAELNYRILSTDFLDDVSGFYVDPALFATNLPANKAEMATFLASRRNELEPGYEFSTADERGDPKDNDAYLSINVKLSLNIGRKRVN